MRTKSLLVFFAFITVAFSCFTSCGVEKEKAIVLNRTCYIDTTYTCDLWWEVEVFVIEDSTFGIVIKKRSSFIYGSLASKSGDTVELPKKWVLYRKKGSLDEVLNLKDFYRADREIYYE